MGRLFAASVYLIVAICAMIFGIGMLVLVKADLPLPLMLSLAGGFALFVVLLQFMLGPVVIDWVVKTRWTTPLELGPDFDKWMRETCATFKIPTPRFGIIEEGAPNAFTYGHAPYDARVVVTRGVIDTLSPEELKAVVAHELGHVKHRDFIVMTMVQALVLVMYALYIASRSNNRNGAWVVVASYIAYWISYYASLLLSRIREYMADYASAQIMRNGNDLSRALIKISYGLARTQAKVSSGYVPAPTATPQSQHAPTATFATAGSLNPYEDQWNSPQQSAPLPTGPDRATLIAQQWNAQAQAKQVPSKRRQQVKDVFSASNLGAFGIAGASSMRSAIAWFGATDQPDPAHFTTAARWELYNPWGRIAELLSTHPLTALRIKALQELNAIWHVPCEFDLAQVKPAKYRHFFRDVIVAMLPLVGAAAGAGIAIASGSHGDMALVRAFIAAGIAYFAMTSLKVLITYPGGFKPNQVLRLLGEVNVSHVNAIPVALEGTFTSRISPGIAWSKDFILQDDTGFVACMYKQPLAIWEFLWGWIGADRYVGRRVRVYGWYRRFGAPYVEIARFETLDTRERVRTYFMPYVLVGSLAVAGLLTWLLIAVR